MIDGEVIARFVATLFCHATGGFVSLRAFHQHARKRAPLHVEAVWVDDAPLTRRASAVAERAAGLSDPAVFAPPICTFNRPDKARAEDIAEGLTPSVEADSAPYRARQTLEHLLGPATLITASGSEWTGEIQDCLHLQWRLSEPTTSPPRHLLLGRSRRWSALRVGADLSGAPIAHPYRWPGSLNRKHTPPRLARIIALNPMPRSSA
jgi:hypothetical protein